MDHRFPTEIDLLAEIRNVELDNVGLTTEIVVSDPVQDLGLGQHPPGVAHQKPQELELGGGQRDQRSGPVHLTGIFIQAEFADSEQGTVAGQRNVRAA